MTLKTYAARGLLDWQFALNVSGAIIRICFCGGSMGSNGVLPAKYTTDNEAIQKIIENTEQFKRGKIFLYHIQKVEEKKTEQPINFRNNGKTENKSVGH